MTGVVTKVALRLAVTPQSSTVLFAKVPSFQQLPKVRLYIKALFILLVYSMRLTV